MAKDRVDLSGKRCGYLTVMELNGKGTHDKWLCICDCGNEVEVYGKHLRTGHTSSCGCMKEVMRLDTSKFRHKKPSK